MDRRTFLGGAVGVGASAAALSHLALAQASGGPAIDVVERFGFVADGRSDNSEAFYRWATFVTQAGGGSYVFPPGRYWVSRYRTGPGSAEPPTIRDCDGLSIVGEGAVILLNGDFNRSARPTAQGRAVGLDTGAFMPFVFRRCRNLRMSGFEIDGGVRAMTRDETVTEIYSYLIALHGCSNVSLSDLNLHHGQTDAILLYEDGRALGRPGAACRDVSLTRVRCANNARGGFAPIQVYGLKCVDCVFLGNWFGLGKYLGHAPGFGVDIEPDLWKPEDIDTKTGNIEFLRCEFTGNSSALLASYPQTYRGFLRVIDCSSSNAERKPYHMIINWPGALVQGGRHDAGDGTIWASWEGVGGGDLTIRQTEIRSSAAWGVFHPHSGNRVIMDEVTLIGTHREPSSAGVLLGLQGDPGGGRRNQLRRCNVFVPGARKGPGLPYDYEVSLFHTASEGNLFRTDLPSTAGQHFCTEYGPGTTVAGDRYRGTRPGPMDSFRPVHMSDFNTLQSYSRG